MAGEPPLLRGISMTQGDDLWHLMVHRLLSHIQTQRSGEKQRCLYFTENCLCPGIRPKKKTASQPRIVIKTKIILKMLEAK